MNSDLVSIQFANIFVCLLHCFPAPSNSMARKVSLTNLGDTLLQELHSYAKKGFAKKLLLMDKNCWDRDWYCSYPAKIHKIYGSTVFFHHPNKIFIRIQLTRWTKRLCKIPRFLSATRLRTGIIEISSTLVDFSLQLPNFQTSANWRSWIVTLPIQYSI